MNRFAWIRLGVVAVGACAAVAALGCGGSTSPPRATDASASSSAGNSSVTEAETVRVADCRLWTVLDAAGRARLLTAMRTFFGGRVDHGNGRGGVLDAAHAARLFDNYCRLPFARAFKLYKLYGRAAAFTPNGG